MAFSNHDKLLTVDDFNLLQKDPQPESRAAIASKIGYHFDSQAKESVEYCIATEIALYLQKDEQMLVRVALSNSVFKSEHAPKKLVLLLAMDEEDAVALPMLQHSPVIDSDDLSEILPKIKVKPRLMAIAERELLSVKVSSLLIEREMEDIVLTLLKNEGAALDEDVMLQIAHKHSRSQAVLSQMMKRMPMQSAAVDHMVQMQQSSGQQNNQPCEIQSFSSLEKDELKNDLLTLMFLGRDPSDEACEHMIRQLEQQSKVSATFMMMAMCLGQQKFFIEAMAHNTHLPVERVIELCAGGKQEFSLLMNKSGISSTLYPLVAHAHQGMREAIELDYQSGTKEFVFSMISCLIEAEEHGVNFASTIGKPLAKALKETFG